MYQYDDDPRVRVDGSGGYTVTTDGGTRDVRYDQRNGWALYVDGNKQVTNGYADPDDVFRLVLGTPYRTATRADVGRPDAAEVTAMLNDPVDGW